MYCRLPLKSIYDRGYILYEMHYRAYSKVTQTRHIVTMRECIPKSLKINNMSLPASWVFINAFITLLVAYLYVLNRSLLTVG